MHFYSVTGEPRYEVPMSTKSGMRPARIADAKKEGWLYSPTTVLDAVKSGSLINWFKRTWAQAGYEFPRNGDFDGVWDEINTAAESTSKAATDFGSQFHDLAEKHALGLSYEVPAELSDTFNAFRDWFAKNVKEVVFAELVLVGDGYGGRSDLCYIHKDGRRVMADYKTQKTTPKKPVAYYETFPVQLAAYAKAWEAKTGHTIDAIESIIVSSTEPGRVESKVYDGDVDRYYALFMGLLEWVCYANDYDPRKANLTVDQKIAAAGL